MLEVFLLPLNIPSQSECPQLYDKLLLVNIFHPRGAGQIARNSSRLYGLHAFLLVSLSCLHYFPLPMFNM